MHHLLEPRTLGSGMHPTFTLPNLSFSSSHMLNCAAAAPIRQIEPRNDRFQHDDRIRQPPRFRDIERPRYDDCYRLVEDRFRPIEDGYGHYRYDYDHDEEYEPRYRHEPRVGDG